MITVMQGVKGESLAHDIWGKPCPRHLCSEAESVIVGYTHSAGMLCNRLRPAMRERRNTHDNTEAGHVLRESSSV